MNHALDHKVVCLRVGRGVVGGGGNALNRMVDEGVRGVEFLSVNTVALDLMKNKADVKVQIGK